MSGGNGTLPILICHSDSPLGVRRKNTTQRLGYDASKVELPVVRNDQQTLPTVTGQSTLGDMYGCGHPEPDDCLFCSVDKYADMVARNDPFIDANKFKARMGALRSYPFESARQAKEGYTYFNHFMEWHRIISTHDYFRLHYAVIRDQLPGIRVRFMTLNNREKDHRYTGMRSIPQEPDTQRKMRKTTTKDSARNPWIFADKEYCSWIYTPPPVSRDNQNRQSLHYVYAQVPTVTEALRYLELVFAPPPPLYQSIMGAMRRSVSQGCVPGGTHNRQHDAKHRFVRRRATEGQFTVQKKASRRTFALLQHTNKRYENERRAEEEEVSKSPDNKDIRDIRSERLQKHQDIRAKFRAGFPSMIFVCDSPILEQRLDYVIRQDDRYINVFHLTTPVTRPPPVGGEWGANAASSDELSISEVSEDFGSPSSSS